MNSYDAVLINAKFCSPGEKLSFPMGLLYLGSVLISEGYKVVLLDCNLRQKSLNEIEKDIQQINSPIFAISSLSNGYSFVKEIVPVIRKNAPNSKILLGGALTFGIPEFILQKTGVDAVVEGEAESCIVPLVKTILSAGEFWNTPGVYAMTECNGIRLPRQRQSVIQDLSALPFPAWHLIDANEYIDRLQHARHSEYMKSFPVLASRGCPYSCNFCSPTLGKRMRVRKRDLADEIELAINQYHIDDVWFTDEEFALSKERVMELCRIMRSISKPLTFTCSMRVDRVSSEILQEMKEAGCRRILYGVESGSPEILKAMNKKFTTCQASEAIIETRRQGIEAYVNFMWGYPGETEDTIRQTAGFMKKHNLYSGFGFTTPLPGTKLFNDALLVGKIQDLDSYLESLGASWTANLAVNLTSIPTQRLIELKRSIQEETFPNRIVLED